MTNDPSVIADAEAQFERLSQELADRLRTHRGDETAERAAIREAVFRYEQIRSKIGEPVEEGAVQFFSGDGIGFERSRRPALMRVDDANEDEVDRWTEMLTSVS